MQLPYNKSLQSRARELRKNSTLSEVLLWNALKQKRALGFDFDRQKVIGNYIVDFYSPRLNLVLEIDGSSHDGKYEYDLERHKYLESFGLTVVHINDKDVKYKMNDVLNMLETLIINIQNGEEIKMSLDD
jgi:very-short-patch-repair endonuclease